MSVELRILRILVDRPEGVYGVDFHKFSGGDLPRGSVYVALGKMVASGLVQSEAEILPHSKKVGVHYERVKYSITESGKKKLQDFCDRYGFIIRRKK